MIDLHPATSLNCLFGRSWPNLVWPLTVMLLGLGCWLLGPMAVQAISDEDIASIGREAAVSLTRAVPSAPPTFGSLMVRLMLSLGAVFGLMALVLWAARRWLPRSVQGGRGGQIDVLASRSVGPRRSLLLVRARGKMVLIGLTPQNIQFLTEIEEDQELSWAEAADHAGLDENSLAAVTAGTTSLENS